MAGSGTKNSQWKGGSFIKDSGYRMVLARGHPRASQSGYVPEHILVCEQALGGPLPDGAVTHHVDENPSNNTNSNLVLCENQAFHRLLHRRADALKACGHADWLKCMICHRYDAPENLMVSVGLTGSNKGWTKAKHSLCSTLIQRKYRADKKARLLTYGGPH